MKGDNIKIEDLDILVARKISKENILRLRMLPYKENDEYVNVMADEKCNDIYKELEFKFEKKIKIDKVDSNTFEHFLNILYLGQEESCHEVIIKDGIKRGASDIHFEPYKDKAIVRFRVDGVLKITYLLTRLEYLVLVSKLKIQASLDITERRKPQDGKIVLKNKNNTYDIRVSILPVIYGEKIVLRIFYGEQFSYDLKNLKLTGEQYAVLEKIVNKKTGLIVVNGPTGSGKSTTLYSILQKQNTSEVNIVTLEDPVEVVMPGINQTMVNSKESIGFSEGLRSIMRQDPDIIMVGEIRDEDTAKMAVRASITGHKVYSTLHCKDPREVIFRLEDMGVEEYLIKDALVGILSQRLIRLLCHDCRELKEEKEVNGVEVKIYSKGRGCSKCNYTGYLGRGLVLSIYNIDKNIKAKLNGIYDDEFMLSNESMVGNLNSFYLNGDISREDYIEFLEREEIDVKNYKKVID